MSDCFECWGSAAALDGRFSCYKYGGRNKNVTVFNEEKP